MAKKCKWLYQPSNKRDYWFHYHTNHDMFALKFCKQCTNFPCFRSPKYLRQYLKQKQICKEEHIKCRYNHEFLLDRDRRSDIYVSAWFEKKSWKRNSKRKHQWKVD